MGYYSIICVFGPLVIFLSGCFGHSPSESGHGHSHSIINPEHSSQQPNKNVHELSHNKEYSHSHQHQEHSTENHEHSHPHPKNIYSVTSSPQASTTNVKIFPTSNFKSSNEKALEKENVSTSEHSSSSCRADESVWVLGLSALLVFYLAVILVGVVAGWKTRGKQQGTTQEQVMLAGRDIGLFVGVLTMGATWVGGGFINGSAQAAFTKDLGLVWTIAPFGYSLSLVLGGTFFARKMRNAEYVTMIDPFTQKYGRWGSLLVLPAAISEIFWSASILSALGTTLHVILNLNHQFSIILSAAIALLYTIFGGLVAVAYTDVIQILFIVVGLFVALPFAITHPAVGDIYAEKLEDGITPAWYGHVEAHQWGKWVDYALLCLCGGIPWQCYFQRVLSAKTAARAQYLSYGGAVIALIMTGPSVLFGAIARATQWTETEYCQQPDPKIVMPLVLKFLTPPSVAWFGLGAISAAVMSSTDSSLLSSSSLLARNVYQKVFRPQASEGEVVIALRCFILLTCVLATTLAITYKSIYDLFVLCGDFMYVMVFPQLVLVLYWPKSNTYGCLANFLLTLVLRLMVGDPTLGIPPTISFGEIVVTCDKGLCSGSVPYRTIVMILGTLVHVLITLITHQLFVRNRLHLRFDFLDCYTTDQKLENVVLRNSAQMKPKEENRPVHAFDKNVGTFHF